MTESQMQRLESHKSEYLSIGITKDGIPRGSIRVPWELTASAFNMRVPDVYLAPDDLDDPQMMETLGKFHMTGCYIFVSLEDYSFLGNFPELWDVYIYNGTKVTDLSFMLQLPEWKQFYLEDAVLEHLEDLFPKDGIRRLHHRCVGFTNCKITDISALEQDTFRLSELVILQPEGTNERGRWRKVRAGKYSYFEYR